MRPFWLIEARLAWRQISSRRRRAVLLSLMLSAGVAAPVAVSSFIGRLDAALEREARSLLGADLEVSGRQELSESDLELLARTLPPGSRTQAGVRLVTMIAVPGTARTRLVELTAVEEGYPFYGTLRLEGPGKKMNSFGSSELPGPEPVCYVQPELLQGLDVSLGGALRIGTKIFRIAGILREEPGLGSSVFAWGPRVLIHKRWVPSTGLAAAGSRISYATRVALPEGNSSESVAERLREVWHLGPRPAPFSERWGEAERVQVRTPRDRQSELRRFFDRLSDYLRLVSILALILGGIGVGHVLRAALDEDKESAATLRALGASPARVARIYFLEAVGIGILGGGIGPILGALGQNAFLLLFQGFLPVPISIGWHGPAILKGWLLGPATAVFFSASPVLALVSVKPAAVFRGQESLASRPLPALGIFLGGSILLLAISVLESRSLLKGGVFTVSFLIGTAILFGLSRSVLPRFARSPWPFLPFGARQGLLNLNRPGLRPHSAAVALGLAAFLMGVLAVYQHSIARELDLERGTGKSPSFFLIDVQDDQAEEVARFLRSVGAGDFVLSPMVKARYRGRNGEGVSESRALTREEERAQRMRSREQNLSFRESPGENETVVAGRWMSSPSGMPEISLEEWFAKQLGARLGDALTFDVQGVPLEGRVTSIRKVRWASFLPTFFVLVSPWALAEAPKTWVGAIRGIPLESKPLLQSGLSRKFPNVTILDLSDTARKIAAVLDRISASIAVLAAFSFVAGLWVLVGIALASARERRREEILFKILGARPGMLLQMAGSEFAALGAFAFGAGLALAVVFGWTLMEKFFEVPFQCPWNLLAALFIGGTGIASGIGTAVCRWIVRGRPLEGLRQE